jgi:glyceraldehyde 3-phosphate dehydrogenase
MNVGGTTLGINGIGRIGKLTLWYHLSEGSFERYVVNTGREAGKRLEDLLHGVLHDSTYGPMERFLFGIGKRAEARVLDETQGLCEIQGKQVRFLRRNRNPKDIEWRREGVELVVDTTGAFCDPAAPPDSTKGSLRGHLEAGAITVILSAPFKASDKSKKLPDDAIMLIDGINHHEYQPARHRVISAASCTTTGLAHMVKPLLDSEETNCLLTASLSTIHAATNTQSVLDSVPSAGAKDLRKNRAVFNNIILSTTGAAEALEQVLPEVKKIGFMADSVRIPTSTVSLINLNLTFHSPLDGRGEPRINRELLNSIYRRAAEGASRDLLVFSEQQNVSSDLLGYPAAVVIEGHDTHTRTSFLEMTPEMLQAAGISSPGPFRIPVTHAKIFGWYDNEFGSYVRCLGRLTVHVARAS